MAALRKATNHPDCLTFQIAPTENTITVCELRPNTSDRAAYSTEQQDLKSLTRVMTHNMSILSYQWQTYNNTSGLCVNVHLVTMLKYRQTVGVVLSLLATYHKRM